ncbi:hypothetical protein QR98_0094890 [Sarcoptes scabiei]|uniref:Anaphase-promoting complex subunit 5 n=1 Tax=Sarcoptes scabiei TaxID=52283 RepID=A0A132AIW3_SARSC|nr:hypothetical protein QR98_0094890 [Sarcoptes scabiei]
MSLIGIFLRKLIIHHERLSYCETSTLFEQLRHYITQSDDTSSKNNLRNLKNRQKNIEVSQIQDFFGIDLTVVETLMLKLPSNSSKMNEMIRNKMDRLTKRIKHQSKCCHSYRMKRKLSLSKLEKSDAQGLDHSLSHKKPACASSCDMEIEVTINNVNDMSLDQTVYEHRLSSESVKEDSREDSSLFRASRSSDKKITPIDQSYDMSQHYLVKQLMKIQYNEKSALSPQQIIQLIQSKFSIHNSFHYFRFIICNYLANLNLVRDPQDSNALSAFTDSRTNAVNANQIGLQSNIQGTSNNNSTSLNTDFLNKKYKSLFRSINFFNLIEFLKYINALRVNNYSLSKKAFFDYFDLKKPSFDNHHIGDSTEEISPIGNDSTNVSNNNGPASRNDGLAASNPIPFHHRFSSYTNDRNCSAVDVVRGKVLNSNCSNYCWSSLNLAMMYSHYRHYRLAYEALVDCLSLARDKRDEPCIQYALLWILQISSNLDHSKNYKRSSETQFDSYKSKIYVDFDLIENIIGLLLNNHLTLPYISGKAFLHFAHLMFLKPTLSECEQFQFSDILDITDEFKVNFKRNPLLPHPFYLSLRFHFSDILGETLNTFSGILNGYGAGHLAAIFARQFLKMDVIEMILDEQIFFLDSNSSIAVRNLAFYIYFFQGDYHLAINLLRNFKNNFSSYNHRCQQILEQAITEINFEHYLNLGEWNSAISCVNSIRNINITKSLLMLAKLKMRQNQSLAALDCINSIRLNNNLARKIDKFESDDFKSHSHYDHDSIREHRTQCSAIARLINKLKKKSMMNSHSDHSDGLKNTVATEPIHISNHHSKNLNFYERIQPPPPDELEPESERPLIPSLDPYSAIECHLIRGTILKDLSILFECVVDSLSYGFKQLECRSLIQIARLQSELYGQHADAVAIMRFIFHRVHSQANLRDVAASLFVYANIVFKICLQNRNLPSNDSNLKTAMIYIKRAILIWDFIQDRIELEQSLKLAALIAHENNNRIERNFFAKRVALIKNRSNCVSKKD